MTEERFESRLDDLFREYAERGVRSVDRFAVAQATLGTARVRPARIPWPSPRPRLALAAMLLLALAATAAIVGSRLLERPAPIVEAPIVEGPAYAAVILRDTPGATNPSVDVVAALADGREQLIRTITSADLDGRVPSANGKVSPNGWLALWMSGAETRGTADAALLDLNDPSRPPTFVTSGSGPSTAWSPTDLFAYPDPSSTACPWTLLITDPRTGATRKMQCLGLPGGGPDTIWAVDGTGLLTRGASDEEPGARQKYKISQVDGSPASRIIGALGTSGPRWVTVGGRELEVCQASGGDPGCTDISVTVNPMAGPGTAWYVNELAPDALSDAAFSFDGTAVWLLLDRNRDQNRTAVLAKATAPGTVAIVTSISVPSGAQHVLFTSHAPDDSMFTILTGLPEDQSGWLILASVDGASIDVDGRVAGFVGGPIVDAAFGSN